MVDERAQLAMLYGSDEAEGLVGIAPNPAGVTLWWRRDGQTVPEQVEYQPSFLLSHRELLDGFKPEPVITELQGASHFNYGHQVSCEDWKHHDAAAAHVNRSYREHRNDFEFEPVLRFSDPLNNYLLATGRTHFKGLELSDLRVLYIALRALPGDGAEYADSTEESDRIVVAGFADGQGWQEVLDLGELSEKQAIERIATVISERDPDVIVGHNAFKFSLSYLAARAQRQRVKLKLGRDGSVMKLRKSRAPAAEKQLEYPRAEIAGRSVVDTWFLAQYYDIVKRELERYDATYVARYLDAELKLPDPLPIWEIEPRYQAEPAGVLADVAHELTAVQKIFRTLSGSYFAQSQMLPLSLQDTVVRGNGMKINYLMLREYLRRGEAIPAPVDGRSFAGGHTDVRLTGRIENVLNVDIASLYPSIMLAQHVKPDTDHGDVFQPLLRELTSQRLAAKRLARSAADEAVRVRADARQAAFKIFINSFFGYLGTNRMNWADPMKAEFITTTGQQLVIELAGHVEAAGGQVIEIDTDGVYFTAPEDVASNAEREALVERINAKLPADIVVELGGYFPAMLSHKVKNYALLHEDGGITVKGSGMKSRGLEPYLHQFIADGIRAILLGRPGLIEERHGELKRQISEGEIDIAQLAKTDTLIESLESYTAKIAAGARNRAAVYEVALRARRPLRPGDQVSYYITGEKATVKAFEAAKPLRQYDAAAPDYNVKYYVKKLDQNLKKIKGFLPEEQHAGLFD